MLAVVQSATSVGVEAVPIQVEVDIAEGLPGFAMVGLPENTVKEARVRIFAAINNSGFVTPNGKISVNLAPAHVRKEGTGFDLPMALGLLCASGVIPKEKLDGLFVLGELSLSGEIRPVRGALAAAEVAQSHRAKQIWVAPENAAEAALMQGIEVRVARHFRDLVHWLVSGDAKGASFYKAETLPEPEDATADLADVRGQFQARRALEIAAAGGHNLLFVGGPGSGKTMMAKRLCSILPPLTQKESLNVTRVYSAAGLTLKGGLVRSRPFRSPHHTTTRAGLCGGGSGYVRPGEMSLALHGVLFLDELPEFPRSVIEILRQPLESGEVVISRANGSVQFPAQFMLVAAMNPCPCGNFGTPRRVCRCSPVDIQRYRSRLSGPLLDRIDLHVHVPPVDLNALQSVHQGESSIQVKQRVLNARAHQHQRLGKERTNASMQRAELVEHATPAQAGAKLLAMAMERLGMSARLYDRTLRVARTIADLADSATIEEQHVAEAIQYRQGEGVV